MSSTELPTIPAGEVESPTVATSPLGKLQRPWRRWLVAVLLLGGLTWFYDYLWARLLVPRAVAALRSREPERALVWLDRVDWLASRDAEAAFQRARTYRNLGRMAEVRTWLERAYELGIPQTRIEREQWLAFAQTGQMKEAEPHLHELLLDPGEDGAEICNAFVNGYYRVLRIDSAQPILEAWITDFPDDPRPHQFNGSRYAQVFKWQEAINAYQRALDRDPTLDELRVKVATSYSELHQYDTAEQLFLEFLKQQPASAEALAGLGEVYLANGRWDEAETVFTKAAALAPEAEMPHRGLGQIASYRKEFSKAVEHLQRAHQVGIKDQETRYHLALALQGAGQVAEAKAHFDFCHLASLARGRRTVLLEQLVKEPKNIEMRFELADLTYRYINEEEGTKWLFYVVELQPDHGPAREILYNHYKNVSPETARRFMPLPSSSETPSKAEVSSSESASPASPQPQ